jgi:MFS family permease
VSYGIRSVRSWDHRHTVLSLCVGSYFAIRFAQLLVSPVVPAILDAYAVTRGTVGVALTGMWVAYALSQLPSGVFSDRFGGRPIVLGALSLSAVGATGLAAAPTYLLFATSAVVLGVGAGLYYNAATALLTARYDDIGRAIGVHRIGGQAAGLAAPVVAAALSARFGWRAAILAGTATAAVLGALVLLRVRPTPPERPDASLESLFAPATLLSLLSRPTVAYTTALAMLLEFAILSTMSFLPTFFVQHHGYSLARAGLLFSAYFAVVGGLQPVVGWLSDRLGRDAVLGVMLVAGVVGYAVLAATTGFPVAVGGVVLVGVAMSWGPPIQSRAVDALSADEQGTGFGLVRTGYILFGALGTTVVGTVADAAGWSWGFGLLAALLGVGGVSMAVTKAVGGEW